MSSPEQIDISFSKSGTDYHIKLVQGKKSDHSIEINGVSYDVLGEENRLKTACEILNSIPSHDRNGILSSEDLKGKLSSLGNISFPSDKVNIVAVATLESAGGITSVATSIVFDHQKKVDTVNNIAQAMREKYVFADKGQECAEHMQKQLKMGSYDDIKDPETFAEVLTKELYNITKDKHIRIDVLTNKPETVEAAPDSVPDEVYKDFHPELDSQKTYKAKTSIGWMGESYLSYEYRSGFLKESPDIGYFVLLKFGVCDAQETYGKKFKKTESKSLAEDVQARRAAFIEGIQHLKNAKAIIIDLRPNSGGDPSAVQLLCSLFMEEGLPLNRIEWRTPDGVKSDDFGTLSKEKLPDALRLKKTPLYILGGPYTFSAGEEFMNNMKVHGRATLVGAQTGGGANPGGMHQVNDLFEIFIPTGRAVNPIKEGNWEGVGITPDHSTKEEQALKTTIALIQTSKS